MIAFESRISLSVAWFFYQLHPALLVRNQYSTITEAGVDLTRMSYDWWFSVLLGHANANTVYFIANFKVIVTKKLTPASAHQYWHNP